jgi:hypothetical protein
LANGGMNPLKDGSSQRFYLKFLFLKVLDAVDRPEDFTKAYR